ncbi:hypothetical protein FGW37_30760 [Streptomyces rectiverticillatus]|uniref:hypothetical protein n=1 Tax=Streptomyces rectiverticillatus TaxID=173860 RepID=UPI0015C3EB2D|nr:hypothetical protein [Streptomyces rectiverticillatus]QLE75383.1 hypothetical protein FGW37_30760 [Streptomyces rectiverticillatus]
MTTLTLTVAAIGAGFTNAESASAGGIGVLLSPAFGTLCVNKTGAHAAGATRAGSGTVSNNLGKVPIFGALNQCGGADTPFLNGDPSVLTGVLPAGDTVKNILGQIIMGKPEIVAKPIRTPFPS